MQVGVRTHYRCGMKQDLPRSFIYYSAGVSAVEVTVLLKDIQNLIPHCNDWTGETYSGRILNEWKLSLHMGK